METEVSTGLARLPGSVSARSDDVGRYDFAQRGVSHWLNTAAFAQASQFTLGNSSGNPVRGPGYQAADLMVGKSSQLLERWNAEFRAEAFNIANTPPLGQPNGSFGSAALGSIAAALDPRVFEVVLKVNF